jgi:hypothetical protein
MSIETLPTPTSAQLRHLAGLAAGRGCPADVASVLERIAAGRYVTGHDVHYVTRSREGARNLYARLRAAGLDILPGSGGTPPQPATAVEAHGGTPPQPATAVEAHGGVRVALVRAAAELADVIDDNAARLSDAELAYGHELGFH